jgi:hypothetical protein
MEEELVRTLGTVKVSEFKKDFDKICDEYNAKAKQMGYNGNLKFEKRRVVKLQFLSQLTIPSSYNWLEHSPDT